MCLNIQTFSDFIIYTFTDKKKRSEIKCGDRAARMTSTVQIQAFEYSSPELAKASDSAAISPLFHALLLGAQSCSSRAITAGKEDAKGSMLIMLGASSDPHGFSREEDAVVECIAAQDG